VCEREGNVEGDFCISENDRDIERLLSYLRKLLEKKNNCVPRLMQWDKILLRKFRGCSTAKNWLVLRFLLMKVNGVCKLVFSISSILVIPKY
jgi:hypothetical protein